MHGRISPKTLELAQKAQQTGSNKWYLICLQSAAKDFLTGKNRNSQTRAVATALTSQGVERAKEFKMAKTTIGKQLAADAQFLAKAHRNYARADISPKGGFNRHLAFN